MRTECRCKGSVLSHNDPSHSRKKGPQSEHEKIQVRDTGEDEVGPESPDEPQQFKNTTSDPCRSEFVNGNRRGKALRFPLRNRD